MEERDIPWSVVVAFTLSMLGFVGAAAAPSLLTFDVLTSTTRQDFVDDITTTAIGLAVVPLLGFAIALAARITILRGQRLGRSLAGTSIALGLLSVLGIAGYVVEADDARDELEEAETRFERGREASQDGLEAEGDLDVSCEGLTREIFDGGEDLREISCNDRWAWVIVEDGSDYGFDMGADLVTGEILGSTTGCPVDDGMPYDIAVEIAPEARFVACTGD